MPRPRIYDNIYMYIYIKRVIHIYLCINQVKDNCFIGIKLKVNAFQFYSIRLYNTCNTRGLLKENNLRRIYILKVAKRVI